jgi:hypothetical protein
MARVLMCLPCLLLALLCQPGFSTQYPLKQVFHVMRLVSSWSFVVSTLSRFSCSYIKLLLYNITPQLWITRLLANFLGLLHLHGLEVILLEEFNNRCRCDWLRVGHSFHLECSIGDTAPPFALFKYM